MTTEASSARTRTGTRFSSILFDPMASRAEHDDPSMFRDLNLDQVFAAVTAGRDGYDLMPFFRAPLRDVRSVEYRHQVQRDLEQQPLAKAVADFIVQMREMRGHLALSRKLRARYQRERWYLAAADVYCQAVTALAAALGPIELSSNGFTALRDYLTGYLRSAEFTGLTADIGAATSALDSVRYCVNIKGSRVRVSRYEDEADYGEQVRRTFAKFARDAAKDYRTGFRNLAEMDSVEERILELVARLYPDDDFELDGPERIFVVTGPNHGGKTTFARMFGQLHYLASLGLPVPAAQAELFLPDRVFTHFEREEDLATLRGKFEDELVRIRAVLEQATGDSVVVMNESFASTSLRDATYVGERVLDRMTATGLLGVYVTFVDELAGRNEACVSMVGTVNPDNPAERTYRVVRKPADGLAYDTYLAEVEARVGELEFRHGTLMSARLGAGNKGSGYVLRRHPEQGWRDWMSGLSRRSGYTFTVPERDENGLLALSDLTNRALGNAANALGQSVDHIRAFFGLIRAELGFYLGCLNLRERLIATGAPVCFPVPGRPVLGQAGRLLLSARGLYDASLALSVRDGAVGNDVDADGKQLIMVTGANQGGKSTFLRGIFTHFKREEDATMEMGKLDEELDRMSRIIDQLRPGCLLLCNESFASTNEREGSEIARQVIRALTGARVRVIFVTHLYDLAGRWYARHDPAALFLRAEREPDGHRTFRVPPGEPLPTSYGQDLYQQVFGTAGT